MQDGTLVLFPTSLTKKEGKKQRERDRKKVKKGGKRTVRDLQMQVNAAFWSNSLENGLRYHLASKTGL